MVDVNEMRRKFPARQGGKKAKDAAIKRIAREYEMKKAELKGLKAPEFRRGVVYYVVIGLGLLLLASLVMSVTGKGGRAPISKAKIQAEKSLQALAVALGRYRYHTGEYPATLEDLASTKIVKAGWNGPYVKKIVDDPWGHDYVYVRNAEGENPTLYSKGPDGLGGTADDFIAEAALFDEPFRDTSWTKEWVPYRLRGYVVAPDEETRKVVQNQVSNYLAASSRAAREAVRAHAAFAASEVTEGDMAAAVAAMDARRKQGPVRMLSHWTHPADADGTEVAVSAQVDGDAAELFVNGESQGRVATVDGVAEWKAAYEPGEAKVIGWRDGSPVGEDAAVTADRPETLRILLLAPAVGDDETGYAVAEAVDGYGWRVPSFASGGDGAAVSFTLEGPGEIVRTSGSAVAFRRKGGSGGPLTLTARCNGLRAASVVVPWRASD